MDYYPGYGYRYNQGRYDEEEEFILPREDQDDFRMPVLPRNRKRWDFDTEDIALEPYGSNVFGERKAGRYANSNPFEVFRKDTNPSFNKENAYAVDQMYPNLDIEQIMDWTYMRPKVNNNAPIFDHRADNESQTPRIIKPIARLDSVGGAYMQDVISQMNYRDRRYGSDEINKAFIVPRMTLRPDVEDIEGPINIIGLCNERERVAKFTADEFVPHFEPIDNNPYNTKRNLTSSDIRKPMTMNAQIEQNDPMVQQKQLNRRNEVRTPMNMAAQVNQAEVKIKNQEPQLERKNMFLNIVTSADVNPMNTLVPKTQLAKDLIRQTKIQPYFTEVQIDDFNLTPQTAQTYIKETREIKPYLVTNEAMLDKEEPFYLNANQKELRNNYRVFTNQGEMLAIYDQALSPFNWTFDAKTRGENCNSKVDQALAQNTMMTMPSYLVQSAPPKIQKGYVDSKESNLSQQNIFLANIQNDEVKRPNVSLGTNKVKPELRSTSNENKPVRIQTRILNR